MTPAAREALRGPVIELARRAGAAIMAVYASDFAVEHKEDRSPLTQADLAAHRVIGAGLDALTPQLPVLSEESAEVAWSERATWRRYWLVDPLDGTREFVKRNGEFTVNIALIEDGEPTLGVIYAPALDELAHAVRGAGASAHDSNGTRGLRVATRHTPPWRVAGSRSHRDPRTEVFLARIGEHELLALGSSLKFCRLAAGELDVYVRYGPTCEWDTAAGQCILEEAGGRLTDLAGEPLTYNRRETLLNPDFIASAGAHDWRVQAA
ncbi:MAG TPA: 3'(2'),5'-bisphosphate nucleotidase CysQ [Candidatus Saccharimonadia bacterium]|nr:3'(2'),5'-bisphosphate nucleotidase CysQ [Candidatus Saccharimonadia bacterium]